MTCPHCNEPILPGEPLAPIVNMKVHHECGLRMVIGSVAHINKRCGCYVTGSQEGDDPKLTPRQAAIAARLAYELQERNN